MEIRPLRTEADYKAALDLLVQNTVYSDKAVTTLSIPDYERVKAALTAGPEAVTLTTKEKLK